MYIDQSRFKSFWANPEKYRLTYECNLHPRIMPYGLARGTAFHRLVELLHHTTMERDFGREHIIKLLLDEDLSQEAIDNAWRMYSVYNGYVNNPHPPKILAMEREWRLSLEYGPETKTDFGHFMCGRVDQVTESDAGVFVVDTKTAHSRTQLVRVKKNWETDVQADFLLIGAKALGYDPKCLIIHVILETTPPRIWELTVTRTPAQLEQIKRSALLTCSLIEHLRSTHGIAEPWPHLATQWPCNTADKCDYRSICERAAPPDFGFQSLEDFKPRKEHLALLANEKETE